MEIIFENITFNYGSSSGEIFNDLSLCMDTSWKLGLIGKNGKGKTSFLYLINKKVEPLKGIVHCPIDTFYFPFESKNPAATTLEVVKDSVEPFCVWEKNMKYLLQKGDEKSISGYGEIEEKYQKAGGYEIDHRIEMELKDAGLSGDLLNKPFNTLSGGEQTKALITSLFLRNYSLALIDEPTNHLDMKGRLKLGDYLANKNGFILVSHDRYFLDICTDHILSLNKNDVRINKGNYSQWKYSMEIEEEFELRKKENLEREVHQLEQAASKRRKWSFLKEKEKIGAHDKGFISHRAAKTMKRAISIEGRIDSKIEEKKLLLKNFEKERKLKLNSNKRLRNILLNMEDVVIKFDGRVIIDKFSLTIHEGERIALLGDNGSGKTSLFKVITGEISCEGHVNIPSHIKYVYARQNPVWKSGSLLDYLKNEKIDVIKFRNVMAVLGIERNIINKPLNFFSMGEKKKIELCKSFLESYDFFIWDEPMNYLDTSGREQIEDVLLRYKPTMLFTEHDRRFIERIATRIIEL